MASTCEGEITLAECTKALSMMQNNKSPGSDALTTEFYRTFWDIISTYVVNSFNYAFNTENLSICQRQGIISLIPKKKKDNLYLKKLETCNFTECRLQDCNQNHCSPHRKSASICDQWHSNRLRRRKIHRRRYQIDFRYNGIH